MCMKRILARAAMAALLLSPAALAQTLTGSQAGQPGVNGSTVPSGNQMGRDLMTAEQFNALQDYADTAKRLTRDDKAKGKTLAELLAGDKATVETAVKTLSLACTVDKAVLAAEGPETIAGKTVNTHTYETACTNGMGYFLTLRDGAPASGQTCFGADALRQSDLKAGRKPAMVCGMPGLGDLKMMAGSVAQQAGAACPVSGYRYIGQNATTHIEFDEVACTGGAGYVLAIALPGSAEGVRATPCHDSAMKGLACTLSGNGGPVITLDTFRDALKTRQITCAAGEKEVRFVGQENVQKRFVVEFSCREHPQGLVAFVPLEGNKAPFEALDCPGAARRGVLCALTK
jgi:hypothetical protein